VETIMEIITLGQIAHARSGDKGSLVNIGVAAHTPSGYEFLREELTTDRVGNYFAALGVTSVQRYELPRLAALNFVLRGALPASASESLRIDTQGKLLGTAILELPLPKPIDLDEMVNQQYA
jgi:hypothetical protein